jgi:hypothetical protein
VTKTLGKCLPKTQELLAGAASLKPFEHEREERGDDC